MFGGDWQVVREQIVLAIEAVDAASTLVARRCRAIDGQLGAKAVQLGQFGGVGILWGTGL